LAIVVSFRGTARPRRLRGAGSVDLGAFVVALLAEGRQHDDPAVLGESNAHKLTKFVSTRSGTASGGPPHVQHGLIEPGVFHRVIPTGLLPLLLGIATTRASRHPSAALLVGPRVDAVVDDGVPTDCPSSGCPPRMSVPFRVDPKETPRSTEGRSQDIRQGSSAAIATVPRQNPNVEIRVPGPHSSG
jgi:hypothetical protein